MELGVDPRHWIADVLCWSKIDELGQVSANQMTGLRPLCLHIYALRNALLGLLNLANTYQSFF
jgi:hypothetical protein